MQKVALISSFVFLFLIGCFFAIKYFVGDIRPAIFPARSIGAFLEKEDSIQTRVTIPGLTFSAEKMPYVLQLPSGYEIRLFGKQAGARDLTFSPEGVLLVSSPSKGEIVAFSIQNQIVVKKIILSDLKGPHGIGFFGGKLFIAEKNRLGRYIWDEQAKSAIFEREILKLPSGGHDAHTIAFDRDGKLYVKIGSSCNVCVEEDPFRASVIRTDVDGNNPVVFASGLRNAAFLQIDPKTNQLWSTENGRDNLGDDLPPEEVNILTEGGNYGWPNCYGERIHDIQFDKNQYIRDPCVDSILPTHSMQAHSAPLGLSFIPESFSSSYNDDLLVAFHGSWNRSAVTGYKIVRLDRENNEVKSEEDFITGFLQGNTAVGRPVDLVFDSSGNLYISDDKGGNIFVVSKVSSH